MGRTVRASAAVLAGALGAACFQSAFVGHTLTSGHASTPLQSLSYTRLGASSLKSAEQMPSNSSNDILSLVAGVCLGVAAFFAAPGSASADVSDIVIPVNSQGKTTTLDKEQLVRGKRLFNQACADCHVGGSTRTNQNVTLALEELNNALPPRNTVESLIDYMNAPTTYDGVSDISETHPSIKAADLWPKMASMKSSDLYDIGCYILYQTQNIPEKWGGGKQYY
eukprot:TRINITY_DN2216_c0_g1_i13.p1 TRINITY_DN2216_c0_g1~~TRINITY_DN2216_c0_g1_i13.p1  ORF type:complete len:224 (-),score=50.14 TRINITY_DN2216_c0_g1_i13:409-1080(-)